MTTARPLLMAGPMVRSTIDGIKTQTRRIVKPQERLRMGTDVLIEGDHQPEYLNEYGSWQQWVPNAKTMRCPYGVPGDLLWVKETFAHVANFPPTVRYYATDDVHELRKKQSSIHMPRWASRLTLELTDVRVERLQDISEEDAEAEGIEYAIRPFGDWKLIPGIWDFEGLVNDGEQRCDPPPAIKYAYLWNSINAKAGTRWADNPWVWVLTFAVHHANVDAVLAQRAEVAA